MRSDVLEILTLTSQLQFVIQEMLTTEEKYVEDLKHVVEGYMEPLTQNPDPEVNSLADSVSLFKN